MPAVATSRRVPTNVAVAKDLMKYWMQPEVTNDNMKAALGRWVPANAQVVKTDPFWLQNTDQHVIPYVKEIMGPTIPFYEGYTPAWGQVNSEQLWGSAHADVIKNGMKASDAIDKAFKRANVIFSNYTIRAKLQHRRPLVQAKCNSFMPNTNGPVFQHGAAASRTVAKV